MADSSSSAGPESPDAGLVHSPDNGLDGSPEPGLEDSPEACIPRRRKGSAFVVSRVPAPSDSTESPGSPGSVESQDSPDHAPAASVPPSLFGLFSPPGEEPPLADRLPRVDRAPGVTGPSSPPQPPHKRTRLTFSPSTKRGSDAGDDLTGNGDVRPSSRLHRQTAVDHQHTPEWTAFPVRSRRASEPPLAPFAVASPSKRRASIRPLLPPPPSPPRSDSPPFHSQDANTHTPSIDGDTPDVTTPPSDVTDSVDPASVTDDVTTPITDNTSLLSSDEHTEPLEPYPELAIIPENRPDDVRTRVNDVTLDDDQEVETPSPETTELLQEEEGRLPRLRKNKNFRVEIIPDPESDEENEDTVLSQDSSCASLAYRITDDDPVYKSVVTPRIGTKNLKLFQRRYTPADKYRDVIIPYNPDDEEDEEKPGGWRGLVYDIKRHNNPTKLFVFVLLFLMVASLTTIWMFYQKIEYEVLIGREVHFWEDSRIVRLVTDPGQEVRLRGKLGVNIPKHVKAQACSQHLDHMEHHHNRFFRKHVDHLCVDWPGHGRLELSEQSVNKLTSCYHVTWTGMKVDIEDCYDMEESYWYGGLVMTNKSWPVAHVERNLTAHVTGDFYRDGVGPILDNYWLSSDGVAILVNESVNLYSRIRFVSGNHSLCLSTARGRPPFPFVSEERNSLTYTVCDSVDIVEMQNHVTKTRRHYKDRSSEHLLRDPACSTWGRFGANITQDSVETLVDEITNSGVNCSQLTVYGEWETVPGSLELDRRKFPDISKMVEKLQNLGIILSFPVHPFVDISATELFKIAAREQLLIRTETDMTPALVYYKGMDRRQEPILGAVINMANVKAREWYLDRVRDFKNRTNIPSVHFTLGHVTWLPPFGRMNATFINPSIYTQFYSLVAGQLDSSAIDFACGSQNLDTVVYIPDRNTSWTNSSGLGSVIPSVLDLSMKGYRFPSIRIGSRLDHPSKAFSEPITKELYIRTLQLATFLPTFELSLLPSDFDTETEQIARTFLRLHREYVSPMVQQLVVRTNETIVRPMWRADVNDTLLYTIDDQFMLGEDIVVAPVIRKGKIGRDIYLPQGRWLDRNLNVEVTGKRWLRKYAVPLRAIAYFERIEMLDEHNYAIKKVAS